MICRRFPRPKFRERFEFGGVSLGADGARIKLCSKSFEHFGATLIFRSLECVYELGVAPELLSPLSGSALLLT